MKFDGGWVSVPSSAALQFADATFSVAAWVDPYAVHGGQQMIVAKNAYSADKREWGLMLDKDNRFRFYLWQKGWKTIASQTRATAGQWHHVAVTVEKGRGRLYVNGKQEAEGRWLRPAGTDAPLTIGGVQDGGAGHADVRGSARRGVALSRRVDAGGDSRDGRRADDAAQDRGRRAGEDLERRRVPKAPRSRCSKT